MLYKIIHRTTYRYKYPVSVGNHVACLTPRTLPHHQLPVEQICRIDPAPATRSERLDYFGNRICFFTIQEPHKQLVVEARSEVIAREHAVARQCLAIRVPWEDVARARFAETAARRGWPLTSLDSSRRAFAIRHGVCGVCARNRLRRGGRWPEALVDLTARIHRDFRFDTKGTNVRTPAEEVFKKRRGVCQDFAHVQIACLRSLGLAARYVSGYLRTYPPPGKPRLIGVDASHAWVSAYCPGMGWLDVDPTNNVVPTDGHVTLAWGRDYGDVSPLRGLVLGGGAHKLRVSVDMEPAGFVVGVNARGECSLRWQNRTFV